ncbi:Asp-tRNA(Asn)/Glu-tRNA(Gln) amidotransferase subunit GatA [Gemmata sp. JC717]|uniref:Asp-tRNA(Asn)/Glu-tRNA(Gln) amidotransferase subunit GatA n=1 Tax=Gemmata algarum TaxID=2975278 RepID=UPI0021BB11D1|nr:Asp-tRNA(Asn)/Glu-tRNA(Gln) amidotransferase subunit GatA [Gemmata algarum]MDY3554805.1 Asp-tRNA(Asn)/Glu-tRNA(Gln) amidotransferase subunit GatA [Gemmata algarum]
MSLIEKTATELLALQSAGKASALEIADAFLASAAAREPKLKSFTLPPDADAVRAAAKAVDAKRAKGEPLGRLAGVPVAVKDVLCTKGVRTTCSSKMLANFVPPYDADAVERLKGADAIVFGKTNMDEFAMGSSTENSAFQATRNPWDVERIPGGSSGGSAAVVAGCQAPLSLGTDTGGSIRQPAALCGIVGLKPTYGRVSRYGLIAFASSLDQVGPFTHDVTDCALMMEAIAGHDARDSTSVAEPVPHYTRTVNDPVKGLRIGVPKEFFGQGLDAEVEAAVRGALKEYEKLGATLVDVSLPHSPYALAAYYIVAPAEASSNLARFDGMHYGHRTATKADLIATYSKSRGEGFGPEVQRRIILGTYVLSSGYKDAYYLKALKVRRLVKKDFDEAFKTCDVVMGPTTPTAAFKAGEKSDDPLALYLSDVYTVSCNLAGIPGLSMPCGFTTAGLPIGLQLLGAPFEEEKLLRVARMYEAATAWHTRRPVV